MMMMMMMREAMLALSWPIFLSNCLFVVDTGKNSGGSNRTQTPDLCDADTMLDYQLSYEATQLGAGQFVGLILFP